MRTQLEKGRVMEINKAIENALQPLLKELGLQSIKAKSATYSPGGSIISKLEILIEGGLDDKAERYVKYAESLGLPPLDTWIKTPDGLCQVKGLNSSATKVLVLRKSNEKRYWINSEFVRIKDKWIGE